MDFETDRVVAVPPWKVEFMERKKKKSKGDEVPQWKRELLKRIHSKNQRMSEQQKQPDIVEEHIPKVSNNIFLVHEKKHHNRFPSAPAPKTISPEVSPTSHPQTLTLSVDNVIIIEKETKNVADEVTSTSSSDSVFGTNEEEKEYPKSGIVNRLLGRFQVDKSTAAKKTHLPAEPYQQSKTTDWKKTAPHPMTPPPTPQSTPVEEKLPPVPASPASPQSTYTMPSDMITPLLISSAKPFSRQSMTNNASGHGYHHVSVPIRKVSGPTSPTNASGHGYHHVSVPIRKVSGPTSPKYTTPAKTEAVHKVVAEAPAKPETSKPVVILEAKQVEPKPRAKLNTDPPVVEPERNSVTASFTEDLSSLHSNPEFFIPPVQVKETAPEKNNASKRITLTNGETLHSSGNEVRPQVRSADGVQTKPIKLQDKSNFTSFSPDVKKSQDEIKLIVDKTQKQDLDTSKKEVLRFQKEPELPKSTARRSDPKAKPFMKENNVSVSRRQEKSENQLKQVVNESLDESTLKTKAAKAANRIMQSSKTFKITPSKTTQEKNAVKSMGTVRVINDSTHQNEKSLSASTPKDEVGLLPNKLVHQQNKPVPSKQHEVVKIETPGSRSVREWPPAKPPSDLPTTSIDDLVDGPSPDAVIITPVSSLLNSPKEQKKEENAMNAKPVVSTVLKITSQPQKENTAPKTQNSYINRTNQNSISITPKSEPTQKKLSFGAKKPSAGGRGKSFVIDPSKFRKSSAQPPTVTAASRAMQESGNTRMIVPSDRPLNSTEADFGGEPPKTGKRKVTVDQITVIGGYVSLERSCLVKETKRKKSVTTLSFSEKVLETTYTYASERSLLEEDTAIEFKKAAKSPGFGKDSTIGKYTPKYLLSMKATEIVDEEDDSSKSKSVTGKKNSDSVSSQPSHATPDDNAAVWSDTTSSSTDILF